MTTFQTVIKYVAMALAVLLAVSIIGGLLSMAGLFGGLLDEDPQPGEMQSYAVSPDIRGIDVELAAADVTIRQGDEFRVESNLQRLLVEEKNGLLVIRETERFGSVYHGAALILSIPADVAFDTIRLKTGAGKVTASPLAADQIDLELGAGEATFSSLTAASRAAIEGGAGAITIAGGTLHHLDLEMGLGRLDCSAALTGDCSFECGMGETNVTVLGRRADYRLNLEKGLGSITVDGAAVSSLQEQGGGANAIRMSGGVGAVNLQFSAPPGDI